jgi:hypothetical protein
MLESANTELAAGDILLAGTRAGKRKGKINDGLWKIA